MTTNTIDWDKVEAYLHGDREQKLNGEEQAIVKLMEDVQKKKILLGAVENADPKRAWAEFIRLQDLPRRHQRYFSYKAVAIAASVIGIAILIGLWIFLNPEPQQQFAKNIVDPALDKVTLLLPGNRKVIIDSAKGNIEEGNISISYNKEGAVFQFKEADKEMSGYNTILVPRGQKYQVVLPDGSKVWLNADSKLHFPARFAKDKREVELNGEGYFEVAHVNASSFEVKYHGQVARVLGTRFNINAYGTDEAITLLQGSVEWAGFNRKILMQPGEQVQVQGKPENKVLTRQVRADDYILWTKNTLLLEHKTIRSLFEDISRYYDVDIDYETTIPDSIRFSGAFEFPPQLDEMISIINSAGKISVQRKDNKLRVSKK